MINEIPESAEQISICHVLSPDEAEEFRILLQDKFRNIKITVDELGPVIGAHLGPGAIGVCYKW
jgi:fatty acid-binding protein DegV